jgi:hypothetical protein
MKNIVLLESGQDVLKVLADNPSLYLELDRDGKDVWLAGNDKSKYELRTSLPDILIAALQECKVRIIRPKDY